MRARFVQIALLMLVGCAGAERSARKDPASDPGPVALELEIDGARLDATLAAVGSAAGVEIALPAEELGKRTVTFHGNALAWRDALARVADAADCAIVESREGFAVRAIPEVTVQGTDMAVRQALELIGVFAGIPLEIDPDVAGTLTLDLKELRWDEALAAVVRATDLHAAMHGQIVRVSQRPVAGQPAVANPEVVGPHLAIAARGVRIVLGRDAPPPPAAFAPAPPERGMRIDVDVENADLADVMRQIGQQVGVNILVEEGKVESVSVSLVQIPWREAVDVIARMTRAEVDELPGGVLMLRSNCRRVTIQFTRANARTVIQLIAAYSGLNVVVTQEVGRIEVTVDLREGAYLGMIEPICRATGLVCERLGPVIVVSTRSHGGDPDIDGLPPVAPTPAEGRTPLRVRARGAPLPALLHLLVSHVRRNVVVGPISGTLDLTLDAAPADAALEALLEAARAMSYVEGNALVVSRGEGVGGPPVLGSIRLPDGNALPLSIQATVLADPTSDEPDSVVIDGRIYRQGDTLMNAQDEDIDGVRIIDVEEGGIRFRVGDVEQFVPFP